MTIARQKIEREARQRTRTERIESMLALGVLVLTLVIVVWTAVAVPAVSDDSDAQVQMWLVGHRFVRPVAIGVIVLVWLAENWSGRFDPRAALTCAVFLCAVVVLDLGTWALIQASPAGPSAGGEAGGSPGAVLWCYAPFPFPGIL
jgi:hypothetical protein